MPLNMTKCTFGVSSCKFLGFMISQRGIEVNPEKIKALLDMRVLTTQKDIQSLIGQVTALARFISKGTADVPPFSKPSRGVRDRSSGLPNAIGPSSLKAYMSRAPLLSTPLLGESLILYLSVSINIHKPNGTELPIYYTSHALQVVELRYPQLEKLAYALVLSARKLQPYFKAHTITVLTN